LEATDWRSVRLVAGIIFITRVQSTVYYASFQPMVKTMDHEMDHAFYSIISGFYSLGAALSAPLFGILANKFEFRRPTLLTVFIMFCGNIGFVFMENIPANRRYFALMCKFIVGIAAGGISVLGTYWVTVIRVEDSATAAAHSRAAMCLGLAFGPLVQLVASKIDYPGYVLFGFVHVNMYTLPAMIAIVRRVFQIYFYLVPSNRSKQKFKNIQDGSAETFSTVDKVAKNEAPLDYFVIFICYLIRFVQSGFDANVQNNNPSFVSWMFTFSREKTSTIGSAICSACGLLGFAFLVAYVWTGAVKKVNNRVGVLTGFTLCLFFLLATFSYPTYSEFITHEDCIYPWCSTTRTISFPLFLVSYLLLFSIGFPLLNLHTTALLAKQLGGRKQAHWHGLSSFVGTSSRVVAAPILAKILQSQGIVFTWFLQIGIIAPMILVIIVCYNRLRTPLRLSELKLFQ
ncbi:hypothetical protein PFISCL1PPCAC_17814, partial [Pristionchus fissidentatus]